MRRWAGERLSGLSRLLFGEQSQSQQSTTGSQDQRDVQPVQPQVDAGAFFASERLRNEQFIENFLSVRSQLWALGCTLLAVGNADPMFAGDEVTYITMSYPVDRIDAIAKILGSSGVSPLVSGSWTDALEGGYSNDNGFRYVLEESPRGRVSLYGGMLSIQDQDRLVM